MPLTSVAVRCHESGAVVFGNSNLTLSIGTPSFSHFLLQERKLDIVMRNPGLAAHVEKRQKRREGLKEPAPTDAVAGFFRIAFNTGLQQRPQAPGEIGPDLTLLSDDVSGREAETWNGLARAQTAQQTLIRYPGP
jgi:hypothetical protein